MAERIFLHVGSPKTGTTFLQEVLWSGRQTALKQGVLLPLSSFYDHFLASVDVREEAFQVQFPSRTIGIWDRLAEEARAWGGTVLVSHELFAVATAEQAARAVKMLGDAEVHVIVTARDLERQIPAEWQEHLKHRSTSTFTEFVSNLRARGPRSAWFWEVQDCADVCRRWGAAVPPGNTHVITVPRGDDVPDLLWQRFATLIGLDPSSFDLLPGKANPSLHAEQAELLRRVNAQLGERLPMPGPYPQTVKEVFAQTVLSRRPGTQVALIGGDRDFALARSQVMVQELAQLDVDVIGDLADLVPPDSPADAVRQATQHPETIPETILLAESVEALGGLLEQLSLERKAKLESANARRRAEADLARNRDELSHLLARHEALKAHDDKLVHDMRHRPLRHLVIGISERRPWLMKIRVGYWRSVNAVRWLTRRTRQD